MGYCGADVRYWEVLFLLQVCLNLWQYQLSERSSCLSRWHLCCHTDKCCHLFISASPGYSLALLTPNLLAQMCQEQLCCPPRAYPPYRQGEHFLPSASAQLSFGLFWERRHISS